MEDFHVLHLLIQRTVRDQKIGLVEELKPRAHDPTHRLPPSRSKRKLPFLEYQNRAATEVYTRVISGVMNALKSNVTTWLVKGLRTNSKAIICVNL